MTNLNKDELLKAVNYLEYKLYQTKGAGIQNGTTDALKKLYINSIDELYDHGELYQQEVLEN